jgi:hypothetical protein
MLTSLLSCRAPTVKQEVRPPDASSRDKTHPPGRRAPSSASPVKKESPLKKGGAAPHGPVDEMVAKKLKIMAMIFDYAKGLKSEDIAAEVSLFGSNVFSEFSPRTYTTGEL